MKVKITGNITNYESKTVGIFTKRQIVFTVCGLVAGVALYALIVNILPTVFATAIAALVFVAIAACGMCKLGGMQLSNVLLRTFKLAAGHGKRRYTIDNIYMEEEDGQARKRK